MESSNMQVWGKPKEVWCGDVLVCKTEGDWFSKLIRIFTRSDASHIALCTIPDPINGNFKILEVGMTIKEAHINDFPNREWTAYRPRKGALPITKVQGMGIVNDLIYFLDRNRVSGTIYPFWKLPFYFLKSDWRAKLLLTGPKQVCSV